MAHFPSPLAAVFPLVGEQRSTCQIPLPLFSLYSMLTPISASSIKRHHKISLPFRLPIWIGTDMDRSISGWEYSVRLLRGINDREQTLPKQPQVDQHHISQICKWTRRADRAGYRPHKREANLKKKLRPQVLRQGYVGAMSSKDGDG